MVDLENTKRVVVEFEERMNTEVRKKKIDRVKDRDLRKRITRKIYRKITVWIRWWKVWDNLLLLK